jgi:hypothetical protein
MNTRTVVIGSERCGFCGRYMIDYLIRVGYKGLANKAVHQQHSSTSNIEVVDFEIPKLQIKWVDQSSSIKPDLLVRSAFHSEPEYTTNITQGCLPWIAWSGESVSIEERNYEPVMRLYSYSDDTEKKIDWSPFGTSLCSTWGPNDRIHQDVEKLFDVITCFSNPVKNRITMFKLLKAKFGDGARSIGKAYNTVGHYQLGDFESDHLLRAYAEAKFILCMENTVREGYITEKLINAFRSNCIPIYWGDNITVKKYFNEKAMICVNDYESMEACADHVYTIATNPDLWKQMLKEPVFVSEEARRFWTLDLENPSQEYVERGKLIWSVLNQNELSA